MRWIFLIGDDKFGLNVIKGLKHINCIDEYMVDVIENRYCVKFENDYLFYDLIEISEEFEEILQLLPYDKPNIVMMTYSSEKCVKDVLKQMKFLTNIYVDNDHGVVASLKEFIKIGMPLE